MHSTAGIDSSMKVLMSLAPENNEDCTMLRTSPEQQGLLEGRRSWCQVMVSLQVYCSYKRILTLSQPFHPAPEYFGTIINVGRRSPRNFRHCNHVNQKISTVEPIRQPYRTTMLSQSTTIISASSSKSLTTLVTHGQ